jgi:hypothetical protein
MTLIKLFVLVYFKAGITIVTESNGELSCSRYGIAAEIHTRRKAINTRSCEMMECTSKSHIFFYVLFYFPIYLIRFNLYVVYKKHRDSDVKQSGDNVKQGVFSLQIRPSSQGEPDYRNKSKGSQIWGANVYTGLIDDYLQKSTQNYSSDLHLFQEYRKKDNFKQFLVSKEMLQIIKS